VGIIAYKKAVKLHQLRHLCVFSPHSLWLKKSATAIILNHKGGTKVLMVVFYHSFIFTTA